MSTEQENAWTTVNRRSKRLAQAQRKTPGPPTQAQATQGTPRSPESHTSENDLRMAIEAQGTKLEEVTQNYRELNIGMAQIQTQMMLLWEKLEPVFKGVENVQEEEEDSVRAETTESGNTVHEMNDEETQDVEVEANLSGNTGNANSTEGKLVVDSNVAGVNPQTTVTTTTIKSNLP